MDFTASMADIARAYRAEHGPGGGKRARKERLVTVDGPTGVGKVQVLKTNM